MMTATILYAHVSSKEQEQEGYSVVVQSSRSLL